MGHYNVGCMDEWHTRMPRLRFEGCSEFNACTLPARQDRCVCGGGGGGEDGGVVGNPRVVVWISHNKVLALAEESLRR